MRIRLPRVIGGVNILDLSQISFQSPDDVKFRSIDVTYDKYGLSSGNIRSFLTRSGSLIPGNSTMIRPILPSSVWMFG